jgi:predicted nucleotidyltransferase
MGKTEIKNKLTKALETCPHRQVTKSLAIFGSYVKGTAKKDSDFDILIELVPKSGIGFFEIGKLNAKCKAWLKNRNRQANKVDWRFTTEGARIKLKKLYPSID